MWKRSLASLRQSALWKRCNSLRRKTVIRVPIHNTETSLRGEKRMGMLTATMENGLVYSMGARLMKALGDLRDE
jgi:hypothetical protein